MKEKDVVLEHISLVTNQKYADLLIIHKEEVGTTMTRTLYFSKVSLNSQDVYDLYQDYDIRYSITVDILHMLKNGARYIDSDIYVDEDGIEHTREIIYILSIINKDDESIYGTVDRTTTVFVKQRDAETGELKNHAVDDTEEVEFYYDVLHEYIAFVTRRRFKKNIFNEAFANLMNSCSEKEELPYSFYLESYNYGMSIEEIKNYIKQIKDIKQLIITYRPANPDEALIRIAQEASDSERIKESNATERSIIYIARGSNCIDGSASIIQEDIDKLEQLNEGIPIEEATQRGYAAIKSVNEKGDVKSTTESKPFVRKIKEMANFVAEAKLGITQILGGFE